MILINKCLPFVTSDESAELAVLINYGYKFCENIQDLTPLQRKYLIELHNHQNNPEKNVKESMKREVMERVKK